jgi:hypothetical protein
VTRPGTLDDHPLSRLTIRRAYLGQVTEPHDTGLRPRRYERLGVRPSRAGLWRKHRQVAKMRYTCKACRSYPGPH